MSAAERKASTLQLLRLVDSADAGIALAYARSVSEDDNCFVDSPPGANAAVAFWKALSAGSAHGAFNPHGTLMLYVPLCHATMSPAGSSLKKDSHFCYPSSRSPLNRYPHPPPTAPYPTSTHPLLSLLLLQSNPPCCAPPSMCHLYLYCCHDSSLPSAPSRLPRTSSSTSAAGAAPGESGEQGGAGILS